MKKIILTIGLLTLIFLLAPVFQARGSTLALTALSNTNFEGWTGTGPSFYSIQSWSDSNVWVDRSDVATTPQVHGGTYSAWIQAIYAQKSNMTQTDTVTNGQTYYFSVWVYDDESNMQVSVCLNDGSDLGCSPETSDSSSWVNIEHSATVSSTSLTVIIMFEPQGAPLSRNSLRDNNLMSIDGTETVQTAIGDIFVDDARLDTTSVPEFSILDIKFLLLVSFVIIGVPIILKATRRLKE
ncbi:MAG: carbohydrate binding domain-containing protein [Candidatus Hodarchaeales archaeon]|jgi:hypothetical protein